ncbi:glucosamine-6-phosphate deaminase [Fretibacter rubidus]|uniref:glucosamine-6-phosphate deaminase n=1 Tax=Fretibacter rubidus TaxID=570162 RepID=UPI00352B98B0
MKHISAPDSQTAALETARIVTDSIAINPQAVLGLATGNTMRPVYRALIDTAQQRAVSFKNVTSFNLDEYLGLPADHPALFARYMMDNLMRHIDMDKNRFHIPCGHTEDPTRTAQDYEAAIAAAGGIDLQLLGVGTNGHIGFNEPGSPRDSRTRVVKLSEQTRRDNFGAITGDGIPERAISMGLATIVSARSVILLATGASKTEAVAQILKGQNNPAWPCSYLSSHSDFTLITDSDARGEA